MATQNVVSKIPFRFSANQSLRMDELLKSELIIAAKNGYAECLKVLLDCNVPKLSMKFLEILLMAAVENGHTRCVKVLLDFHVNPNLYMDKFLKRSFHCVVKDHTEYVKILHDYIADINLNTNELSETALISPAKKGHMECLKILGEQNANQYLNMSVLSETPLIAAVKGGHTECVKILLRHKADPNLQKDRLQETPLIVAAGNGHTECVKLLIRYKSDPNLSTGNIRETPLIAAARKGHAECVKILLKHKADPNWKMNHLQGTPLIAAVNNGHSECVKILLKYKSDPNLSVDEYSDTPLIVAVKNNHTECVKILLDYSADPNLKMNKFSETPLIAAARHGHIECVKILLDYKSDPNLTVDKFPESPLLAAVKNCDVECIKILLEYNADPDNVGYTLCLGAIIKPLHIAVCNNNPACVKLLSDKMDFKPLQYVDTYPDYSCALQMAVMCRYHECLEVLLSCGFPVDSFHYREKNQFDSWNYHLVDVPPLCHGETALSLAVSIGDFDSMKILLKHGASVNPVYYSVNYNDGVQLKFSYPPIFSALSNERETADFLIEHGCDISYHRKDVPSNECLLFSFCKYSNTKYLLMWGSDPHLLFQKGSIHSQQYLVDSLTSDMLLINQYDILDILKLLLQFTAVTGPVQSSFHAISVKCQKVFEDEYDAERWNDILHEVDKPSSLKKLCRVKMRQLMISKYGCFSFRAAINNLCLPQVLKNYLSYSELDY